MVGKTDPPPAGSRNPKAFMVVISTLQWQCSPNKADDGHRGLSAIPDKRTPPAKLDKSISAACYCLPLQIIAFPPLASSLLREALCYFAYFTD